jgi:hypothetical protein
MNRLLIVNIANEKHSTKSFDKFVFVKPQIAVQLLADYKDGNESESVNKIFFISQNKKVRRLKPDFRIRFFK